MMNRYIPLVVLSIALAACAGVPEQRQAISGEWPSGSRDIALLAARPDASPLDARAREAVTRALIRHGYHLAPSAPDQIELAFSERPASLGIETKEGKPLAPVLHRHFPQSCRHTSYRLTLAYFRAGTTVAAGHAAIEDSVCHGSWDAELAPLADALVSQILGAAPTSG